MAFHDQRSRLQLAYSKNRIAAPYPAVALFFVVPVAMPPSSLEERVRELCAQAVAAKTEAELRVVLPQLQVAIHDHIRYVRAIAVEAIPQAFGSDSRSGSRLGVSDPAGGSRPEVRK